MAKNRKQSVIYLLIVAALFSMYQESRATANKSNQSAKLTEKKQSSTPEISYTVSMSKPATHLLEVEIRVKSAVPETLELKMPVWTPGSYLVREYARHVQNFAAKDGSGKALSWRKTNKNTWAIDSNRVGEVVVTYLVYSNELTVRTNELNDEHAFWNNAALLMFPKGQLAAPTTLTVVPFGNWKIATGLAKVPGRANTFRAANYDVLYDAPFEVSSFNEITFDVRRKSHRIVVTGEGNYDLKQMAKDFAKIVEQSFNIFGDLPYDDYTFIVNLRGGGGLEHLNSTAVQWNRFAFKGSRYNAFLGLIAHEFFHLWNVKRIKPDTLGPFDYENENYTKLLWVAEGTTAYYEGILLRRAGLISEADLLSGKATLIEQLQARPGRFETSLEEASLDAWIKYYRQDENSINNQISYYDKGEVVSMMLDATIRTASGGNKSLDDVLRHLYDEFAKKNKNYTPEDFQRISEMMAGKSLDDFFAKYVRGEAEIDYDQILSGLGIRLAVSEPGKGKAYLGADLTEENGRLTIRTIAANTPAYEQGLNTGDQIIAIDGYRASLSFLQTYIGERKPGEKIQLTIFRFDRLRDVTFTLGSDQKKTYTLAAIPNASRQQKRLFENYVSSSVK